MQSEKVRISKDVMEIAEIGKQVKGLPGERGVIEAIVRTYAAEWMDLTPEELSKRLKERQEDLEDLLFRVDPSDLSGGDDPCISLK